MAPAVVEQRRQRGGARVPRQPAARPPSPPSRCPAAGEMTGAGGAPLRSWGAPWGSRRNSYLAPFPPTMGVRGLCAAQQQAGERQPHPGDSSTTCCGGDAGPAHPPPQRRGAGAEAPPGPSSVGPSSVCMSQEFTRVWFVACVGYAPSTGALPASGDNTGRAAGGARSGEVRSGAGGVSAAEGGRPAPAPKNQMGASGAGLARRGAAAPPPMP